MRNSCKIMTCIVICLMTIHDIFPQNPPTDSDMPFDPRSQMQKPVSDAQSLGKFGEIPVDLFTGRVNIDIPIYTIKYYDLEVPISISYHGGGIKVTDEGGSVGLGWTLNVGGVVNRIVRGMPDELHANNVAGYKNLNQLNIPGSYNNYIDFINVIKRRNPERDPIALLYPLKDTEKYVGNMIFYYGDIYDQGRFDTAPDNYTFNVQGLSGAFVHKDNSATLQSDHVILQSNDGVTVERITGYGYVVKDANGYAYQFYEDEEQTYFYKAGYSWNMNDWENLPEYCYKYPSSWWLSSIISPTDGNTRILFHYLESPAKIVYPKVRSYGYTQIIRRYASPDGGFYTDHHEFNSGLKADTIYKKVLDSISTPNCTVKFNYTIQTPSSAYSPRLNEIIVSRRGNPGEVIEKIKFEYNNMGIMGKTKLLRLTKSGTADTEKQSYLFSYNPSDAALNDLRSDHWGYFAPDSKGRFPNKRYFGIDLAIGGSNPDYTDRYANNATAANGMLSKITYPTGGTSEFVWEPHAYSKLSQAGERAYLDRPLEDEIIYNPQYDIEKVLTLWGKQYKEVLSMSHTISAPRDIMIDLTMYYPSFNLQPDCPYCIDYWKDGNDIPPSLIGDRTHIRVEKNGQVVQVIHICEDTYQKTITIHDAAPGTYQFTLCNPRSNFYQNICAQCNVYYTDYFNRCAQDGITDCSDYGQVKIKFGHLTSPYTGHESKDAGGVRIKRITNKSANDIALIKEYNYVEDPSDPSSPSTGVLAYPPRYGSKIARCETVLIYHPKGVGEPARITDCPDLLTLRSHGLPYSLNGGSHIEYSKVIESVVETAGLPFNNPSQKPLRRTIYSYWTAADNDCSDIDDTGYGYWIPSDMLQLTSQNYKRGHLKEKIEYTDERKTTTYGYEILEADVTDTITGSLFTVADYTRTVDGYLNLDNTTFYPYKDLGIVKYRVIPYNKRLRQIRTEGSKTDDYQAYTYTNDTYSDFRWANMPKSHSTIDSEGDTITRHFTYKDVTTGAPYTYQIKKVHTCVTAKKGKIIDAYRNEYDSQGRITEKCVALLDPADLPPANNYNAVTLTKDTIESYLYHNNRLVQLNDHRSGISTVYLWSYNKAYPVAEIQNATFSDIYTRLGYTAMATLFETYTPDMNMLNGLRTALPGSMVSTMTYKTLAGISSFTDPRGVTTYYDYNSFGQLKECYIIENGQKKIIQKMEYQWASGN